MNGAGTVPGTTEPPIPETPDEPYAVLRNRDFLLYLIGRFIGSFGQQMLAVAVGWEIFDRTGSYLGLGMVGLVQMLPMFIFTFPAGHVADNYNRKRIILWTQFVFAIACAALTVISALRADVFWIYCCLFVIGTARTYTWPASASFMPQLVPRKQFARAVSWNAGTFQIAAVLGPAAGGFLIAATHFAGAKSFDGSAGHSAVWVYALNSLASLVCLALIAGVRTHHRVVAKEPLSLKSTVVGLKFVYRTKIVLGSITLDLFAVVFGGATAMLPVYTKTILHVGPTALGWLQSALPMGSLLMSIILVHRPPLQRAGRTLLWAVALFGLATIGFGFARTFWFAFLMLFACGVTDYISVMVRHTLVQLLTPDEMRGRVSAINSLFIGTSNQLGEFESGFAAHFWGPVASVVTGGIGTILVVIAVGWAWPQIRKYGRLDA